MILYQILMALALPALALHALWRGGPAALRDRLGQVAGPGAKGPRLWLHGASLGELTSARWVVVALLQARPDLQILITCNTATARAMVAGWGMAQVQAALAPFDTAGAAGRVLDRWQPQALIVVENELWPARIAAADRRGVQVLVIGARLSDRSARRWAIWPGLIGATLARIDWLSPQDDASAQHLLALGLSPQALGPKVMLKSQALPAVADPPFVPPAPRAQTLLAASTHPGEEAGIVAQFSLARAKGGPRFLILAPRHPDRGDEVADILAGCGLTVARRSAGEVPTAETAIYLADTLGEMGHWYAMAGLCLIGGSFAPKGGHTPFEPAHFGSAILHGSSVHNAAAPFAALDQGGGAVPLAQITDLSDALLRLDATAQVRLASAASACLTPFAEGAAAIPDRVLLALKPRQPRPKCDTLPKKQGKSA